jgi:quercetin dioxygenase-like cupin family protein
MTNPEIKIGSTAGVFTRMMHFQSVGDVEHGHFHSYDHITMLAYGSLKVTVDGKETVFQAPHLIYIKKDKRHTLEALESNTVAACIHYNRALPGATAEELITPDMIPNGVTYVDPSS